jgi:uncharacterized membrane protein YcaP (DUF421 family)
METVIRVAVVYVFLMLALRILGKRELSEMSPFDLVTLLLVPELFQQALVRDDFSMTNAIVGVSTLFTLVFLTSLLTHRWSRFGRVVEGSPTVLVQDGKLFARAMNRERVHADELIGEMHKAGIERVAQVKWAILGTDGKIAFIPADDRDRHPRQGSERTTPA